MIELTVKTTMKKILLFSLLVLSLEKTSAQYFYDVYPITVNQTFNGSQYRLELSCYDSVLATTVTYNTPYHDSYTYSGGNGILAFEGSDCPTTYTTEIGMIIYDYLLHQYKTFNSTYDCDQQPSINGYGMSFWYSYYTNFSQSNEHSESGYYDLLHHKFVSDGQTGHGASGFATVAFSPPFLYTNCHHMIEPEENYYFMNPVSGSFSPLGGATHEFGTVNQSGLSVYSYSTSGWTDDLDVNIWGPHTTWNAPYFNDAEFSVNQDLYVIRDKTSDIIFLYKYDVHLQSWQIDSFPPGSIDSWAVGQNVVGLKNSAGNMVYGAVYNFNQHQWIKDSVSTPSVNGLSVGNGTISWGNGSTNVIFGYNPSSNSWGNFNTVLTPIFYVNDFADTSCGNLIFIRDYSIGAMSFSVDYGDGYIGQTNNWHLYKKNGSYQYQGVLNDTICYTVTNSSGSATNCSKFSCNFGLAKISSPATTCCIGDSIRMVANSATGLLYEWYLNNNIISGATDSVYYASSTGTYKCLVSDSCNSRVSNTIIITVHLPIANATITSNYPPNICSNISGVRLTASPFAQGHTYQWRKNGVNIAIPSWSYSPYIIPTNDTYDCIITNTCNSDTTSSFTFNVQVAHTVSVSAYPSAICPGGVNAQLNVIPGTGYGYQWRRYSSNIIGATTSSLSVSNTGSYSCLVFDSICSVTSSNQYVSTSTNPPANITPGGSLSFCSPGSVNLSANNLSGATYQWYRNSYLLSGATSQNYLATQRGSYQVKVTRSNGCDSLSFPIIVTVPCANINGGANGGYPINRVLNTGEYNVFPNPISQKLFLEFIPWQSGIIDFKIFDVLGKEIFKNHFATDGGYDIKEYDVATIKQGIYFVEVADGNTKKVFKITKN